MRVIQYDRNLGANKPLYTPKVITLICGAEGDGITLSPGAGSSTDAVNVSLRFVWKIVVDDMRDTVDVDTASCDVRSD